MSIKRAVHVVTLQPSGYTFKGRLFGLSYGCWIVSRKVAAEICRLYGHELPRCGYDRILDSTRYNYVTNESNARFRVSLQAPSYDVAPTGKFA